MSAVHPILPLKFKGRFIRLYKTCHGRMMDIKVICSRSGCSRNGIVTLMIDIMLEDGKK